MMRRTQDDKPGTTRQSPNSDTSKSPHPEPQAQPEAELPRSALKYESSPQTDADKALLIELELFVGQLLKQIEFPEQSSFAVDALTETLSEFIHKVMKGGGIDLLVPGQEEHASGDLQAALSDAEIESPALTATALPAPIKPEGEAASQLPQSVPAPPSTAAAPTVEIPLAEGDADDAAFARSSPAVDPQNQVTQKTMTPTVAAAPDRPQLDVAPIETPRQTREGDRQQLSAQRSESVAPDLSRMQRVNTAAGISHHHNGILIADSGHKIYEIRFASAELGQIRVELQMDGLKPEASVLFNNADAEKPLRDLFGQLQTRMAGLGFENLSLRQDTGHNPGGEDASVKLGIEDAETTIGKTDTADTTYYIAPDMTEPGRLDIRF